MALKPLVAAIADHARAGPRVHVDDTPVPLLAKGKTKTGRLWTMVRDDRPFGDNNPPAAAYVYSLDRGGEHAETFLAGFAGIMQADAFSGFNRLYEKGALVEASVLGARTEEVLRAGAVEEGAHRHRGGGPHRRPVRH